jgi:hypothetical protein
MGASDRGRSLLGSRSGSWPIDLSGHFLRVASRCRRRSAAALGQLDHSCRAQARACARSVTSVRASADGRPRARAFLCVAAGAAAFWLLAQLARRSCQ